MAATNPVPENHPNAAPQPAHELDSPPWQRVESTLMSAAAAIRNAYDCRLAPLGLNLSQASLLSYICDFGPVSQTRAATHLSQGRAVTGTQIDKLEARGLVERQPDPADRRVWLVAGTPSGRALAESVADVDAVLRRELRVGISREERQALAKLLVRLQRNLEPATDLDLRSSTPADNPPDNSPDNPLAEPSLHEGTAS